MKVISETTDGSATETSFSFESVSLFNPKFVGLTVEGTESVPPVIPIEMDIREVAQMPPYEFKVVDYQIDFVIKIDPAPYVFTGDDDWGSKLPWADADVTLG